jgi:hypothetical protein
MVNRPLLGDEPELLILPFILVSGTTCSPGTRATGVGNLSRLGLKTGIPAHELGMKASAMQVAFHRLVTQSQTARCRDPFLVLKTRVYLLVFWIFLTRFLNWLSELGPPSNSAK